MRAFLSWLLISLACLTLIVLSHTLGLPVWLQQRTWLLRGLHIALLAGFLMSGIGACYRWPSWRRRRLPTAAIEPFRCLQSGGKFDGEVVAMRLAAMIEQEAGTKRKSLELISSTPSPSIDVKLGAAGSISVPAAWLKIVWRWISARDVIQAQGIICDQATPGSIVVSMGGVQYRYPIDADNVGIERTLAWIARALLQFLTPMRMARRYAMEMNYPAASQVYNAHLLQRGALPEIQLELAGVELASCRYDRAFARLQLTGQQKLSDAQKAELCRLMGTVHLRRGEYEQCAASIRAGMASFKAEAQPSRRRKHRPWKKAVVLTAQKAAFHQLRAVLAIAQDDLESAEKEWMRVVDAIKEELQRHIQSPLGAIGGWSQLEDELSAARGMNDLFPLVYNLCDAWLNRALCLERLHRPGGEDSDLDNSFGAALSSLRSLRLLNETYALTVGARCHRAYARSLQRCGYIDRMKSYLDTALSFGDAAVKAVTYESPYHLNEPAIPCGLAWIHLGRVDCLQRRMAMLSEGAPEKQSLTMQRDQAVAECNRNLAMLGNIIPDWFYEAEASYGQAALAAVQGDLSTSLSFLQTAMSYTRSDEHAYPDVAIRVKMDESFDTVRATEAFQQAIHPPESSKGNAPEARA